MKQFIDKAFLRWHYPVSVPMDIGNALGIDIPVCVEFKELLSILCDSSLKISRLEKFMSRESVAKCFESAVKAEHFAYTSVYSYSFPSGWMEFVIYFDENECLRRIYIHHNDLNKDDGVEIPLLNKGSSEIKNVS